MNISSVTNTELTQTIEARLFEYCGESNARYAMLAPGFKLGYNYAIAEYNKAVKKLEELLDERAAEINKLKLGK